MYSIMHLRRWAAIGTTVAALVAVFAIMSTTSGATTRSGASGTAATVVAGSRTPAADEVAPPLPFVSRLPGPAPSPSARPTVAPSAQATRKRPNAAPKAAPTPKRTGKASTPVIATNIASRLTTLPAATTQVIIVHAPTANTTHATLETFDRVNGVWVRAFASMAARIGADGFSDHHVEDIPTTPTGVYGFGPTMYGINSDPGVKFSYHPLVTNDWWNENSNSTRYNTFEHVTSSPGGASEALWRQTVAYQYFAFITYNVPAVAGAGSAIFLHVGTGGSTAGCVSLPKADLIKVLTWLNPSKTPRIVLSTDANLHRY